MYFFKAYFTLFFIIVVSFDNFKIYKHLILFYLFLYFYNNKSVLRKLFYYHFVFLVFFYIKYNLNKCDNLSDSGGTGSTFKGHKKGYGPGFEL